MSLPAHIRTIAEQVLTEKQLQAFELRFGQRWSHDRIGNYLEIRKQSVMDRLDAAELRLRKVGVRQDANGDWYEEEAA